VDGFSVDEVEVKKGIEEVELMGLKLKWTAAWLISATVCWTAYVPLMISSVVLRWKTMLH
jgi:hypothetical protein